MIIDTHSWHPLNFCIYAFATTLIASFYFNGFIILFIMNEILIQISIFLLFSGCESKPYVPTYPA